MKPAADPRRRHIAAIHAQAKKLGMDAEVRRDVQRRITGKASSATMSLAELRAVRDELSRLEGNPSTFDASQDAPKNLSTRPMLGKVGALLADGRKPWAYAHATAQRMFTVERAEWLKDDQLHRLIGALSIAANRRKPRRKEA